MPAFPEPLYTHLRSDAVSITSQRTVMIGCTNGAAFLDVPCQKSSISSILIEHNFMMGTCNLHSQFWCKHWIWRTRSNCTCLAQCLLTTTHTVSLLFCLGSFTSKIELPLPQCHSCCKCSAACFLVHPCHLPMPTSERIARLLGTIDIEHKISVLCVQMHL